MFYNKYIKLCEGKGVAPTTVLTELGISKSTIANWKLGSEPTNRTKKQLADYFGVTVQELISEEKEKSTPISESGLSEQYDKEFVELYAKLTDDQKKMFLAQIRGVLNNR